MGRFNFFLHTLLSFSLAVAEDIQYCDGSPYYPSQYTCYDGTLCPVVNGEPTLKCGDMTCYSSRTYNCTNGTLTMLGPVRGPYQIVADNPTQVFHDQIINACGRHFLIGAGACTYCPTQAGDVCLGLQNITALVGGSGMSAVVPGGQYFYIDPDGALGFTEAHSGEYPPGSIFGASALEGGGFMYGSGGGWFACPTPAPQQWQVFQKLGGVELDGSCVGLNIVTAELPSGSYAWEYT